MAENIDNPPAFPRAHLGNDGMSLRDWYAGQALVGLLSCGQWHNTGDGFAEHIAERSGEIANAMLAERAKALEG